MWFVTGAEFVWICVSNLSIEWMLHLSDPLIFPGYASDRNMKKPVQLAALLFTIGII